MEIRKAKIEEAGLVAALAVQMWESHTVTDLQEEFEAYIRDGGAVFLAWKNEETIGFAQCGFRHDYVEGTESSPVGYLEGIFIREEYRKQGYAKKLLSKCEEWAKEQGCSEFASDCELKNEISIEFHIKMRFEEAK